MTGQINDVRPVAWCAGLDATVDGWMDVKAWSEGEFTTPLYAAPPAPLVSPAGAPNVRSDAEQWGNALNEASWAFIEACPEKSALLFNTSKASLRTAILKYLDLVAAAPSAPSEAQS